MPVPNVSKEIGDIIDTSKEKTIEKTIVDGNDEGSSALNEAADEKKDDIIDAVEKAKGLLEIKKGGSILFQSEVKNEKNNSNEDCSMNSSNKKVKLN
jgi:hypothetical protein